MSTKPDISSTATPKNKASNHVSLDFVKEQIIENLFLKYNGARPDLQGRLEAAYLSKYGCSLPDADDVRAVFTEGLPGHGKTTIHQEACKEFAGLMGMKFVSEPSQADLVSGKVDANTFVFSILTIAGATSKHEIHGLMAKMRVGDQEFMGHLPDWKLAATMMGGFGYVFFDDFTTAAHPVQNACFDLLLGGSAGDMNLKQMSKSKFKLENGVLIGTLDPELDAAVDKLGGGDMRKGASPVHIGLAANRGVSDGNKIFPRTSALTNRVMLFDVFDVPENFIKRAVGKYKNDSLSDAHYGMFIKQFPELFSIIPKDVNGNKPPFPSPRSHDAAMAKVRVIIGKHGGTEAIAADDKVRARVVREIEMVASSIIGESVSPNDAKTSDKQFYFPASTLSAFYDELFLGAIPAAEEIIKRGNVNEELIRSKYNNGGDTAGQNFGYQFANALAQMAAGEIAEKIKKSGKKPIDQLSNADSPLSLEVRDTLKNLSAGVSFLQKSFVSYALERFNNRLSVIVPEIYEGTTYKILPASTMRTVMFGLIKDNTKYQTQELYDTFVNSISQSYGTMGSMNGFKDDEIKRAIGGRKTAAKKALLEL